MLINNPPTVDIPTGQPEKYVKLSNTLLNSNDAETNTNATAYTKVKESKSPQGNLRVKFDMCQPDTGATVYGRVYVNGSAVGAEHSWTIGGWITYSDDLTGIAKEDLIQIYAYTISSSWPVHIRNFRIYGDYVLFENTLT